MKSLDAHTAEAAPPRAPRTDADREGSPDGAPPPVEAARLVRGIRADGLALTLAEHVSLHGSQPDLGPPGDERLARLVGQAGLLGRGGGRYPLADKLRAVRKETGPLRQAYVVVNATESEPASRKDALLVTRTPHLVLDGAALAAHAVRAREAVVWLHAGDDEARRRVERAAAERVAAGLTGVRFQVREAPPGYVAGEATAVVRALSGGPARPTTAPPHLARKGVDGRPTLVSNAETLAHVALIARWGSRWFGSLGQVDEPGTMLLTLAGAVGVPGVVEAAVGTGIGTLVAAAGGTTGEVAAFLVGGYAGTWLRPDEAVRAAYSMSGLEAVGATPGVGLVVALPPDACPVVETARLTAWLAGASSGQCGPCRNGLPALSGSAALLSTGGPDAVLAPARLARWAAMVIGRGACHHPDGVASLVTSLLRAFPGEVARHAEGQGCSRPGRPYLEIPPGVPQGLPS